MALPEASFLCVSSGSMRLTFALSNVRLLSAARTGLLGAAGKMLQNPG